MGPDYLRGVLAACRVTGMLARPDLGEQYGDAPIILGTAGEIRRGNGTGLLQHDAGGRQGGVDHDSREHGGGGWCVGTVVADTTSELARTSRRQSELDFWRSIGLAAYSATAWTQVGVRRRRQRGARSGT